MAMNRSVRFGEWLVAIVIVMCLAALILPGIRSGVTPPRTQCASMLRNLNLALQTYHANHGSFPPAYIADESGQPMHSWRVLLLPYLEQQALYEKYRFDEPWNGPNNSKLAELIPQIYQCSEDAGERRVPQPWTSYVAITGERTIWPGTESSSLENVPDGAYRTLLIVEVHDSGIHWMEPRDLELNTMSLQINSSEKLGIASPHSGVANVMFADGHGGSLSEALNSDILRQFIEIDDSGPESESSY